MAAPLVVRRSDSTASLANNVTGTSFAAKARAAELNAVRARKAAREKEMEMEIEAEVPAIAPVALGALKFSKPFNGDKSTMSLTLDQYSEQCFQNSNISKQGLETKTSPTLQPNQNLYGRDNPSEISDKAISDDINGQSSRCHSFAANSSHQESVGSPYAQEPHNELSHSNNETDHDVLGATRTDINRVKNIWDGQTVPQRSFILQTLPKDFLRRRQASCSLPVPSSVEDRKPGNDYSTQPAANDLHLQEGGMNDPFLEQTKVLQPPSREIHMQNQQHGLVNYPMMNGSRPGASRAMTSNSQFSVTSQQYPFGLTQQSTTKIQEELPEIASSGVKVFPHQRDPRPYSSFSISDKGKKSILLQKLHDVVESSQPKGKPSNVARTVLYDQLGRESIDQTQFTGAEVAFRSAQDLTQIQTTSVISCDASKGLLNDKPELAITSRPDHSRDISSPHTPSVNLPTSTPSDAKVSPSSVSYNQPTLWTYSSKSNIAGQGFQSSNIQVQSSSHLDDAYIGKMAEALSTTETAEAKAARTLMEPVFRNFLACKDKSNNDYFSRFGRVPEWCIDPSPDGDQSYFGDWGAPPPRVGRDPRYRPTLYEGRYTVFETLGKGRGGKEGPARRYH